jgi:hypothetical protein
MWRNLVTAQVTPPRRPPRKPSHGTRNATIGVVAVFVILAALGSAASHRTDTTGPTVPPDLASSDAGPDASEAGSPTPAGTTLLSITGTGPMTSEPFAASGNSVDVTYDYKCPAEDSFTINFYGTSSSPLLPEVLASEFGTSGSSTVTENLNGAPGPFTVEVDSPCTWTVEVVGAP